VNFFEGYMAAQEIIENATANLGFLGYLSLNIKNRSGEVP